MLPGIKTERPKEDDFRVSSVFADIVVKNVFSQNKNSEALTAGINYWHHYISKGSKGVFSLISTLIDAGTLTEEDVNDDVVYILAFNFKNFKEAAYAAVVREWVIAEGIRFNAKEGDAIDFLETGSSHPRVGTVLAVDKGLARGLVQWRGAGDKLVRDYVPAERVAKVYKNGKPFDNNPRGGKVGFSTPEFTEAVAA